MAGDKPWPQVPIGNKNHANAAVLIIGAGFSGICTAIDLIKRNNCRNFLIVEKSTGIGGTWHDNKYPGCCCDIWSALYSFSFAQNTDWTRQYPGQEEILHYLVDIAQKYDIYQHIRFNTTVEEAVWDDKQLKWRTRVTTTGKDAEFNPEYEINSDFLVSAVGQLNQPRWPDLKGIESFEGKKIHSARWDWSYDLTGKKIALIGNGCTSVQILPEIADVAEQVTIFQRTPNYVVPRLDAPIGPIERGIYKYLRPVLWRRRALMMDFREAFHPAVTDKTSPAAKELRKQCLDQMHAALPGQQELWDILTPKYEPGAKRVIISDDYYPALAKSNVKLETRPIHEISQHTVSVKEQDGQVKDAASEFDLLIFATGFQTVDFLHPIKIIGRNGRALNDVWKDGAQALYGITTEDMPNFAMLYGPNTNLGHNSIILMIEAQSRYINGLVAPVLQARSIGKALAIYPKPERLSTFNSDIQATLQASTFNDPNCTSWYRNAAGRITNNWSGTVVEYQELLSKVDFDEYKVEGEIGVVKPQVYLGRVVEETQVSNVTLALGVLSAAAIGAGYLLRNSHLASGLLSRQ